MILIEYWVKECGGRTFNTPIK